MKGEREEVASFEFESDYLLKILTGIPLFTYKMRDSKMSAAANVTGLKVDVNLFQ